MSQNQSRSVRATKAGIKKIDEARLQKGLAEETKIWSLEKLAAKSHVEVTTVKRLRQGTPVDRDSVLAIAKALDLKPEEIVDPQEWNPSVLSPTPVEETQTEINWRAICQQILAEQRQRLAFRKQITGRECGHEANIYVPLGLVKPRTAPKREPNFAPTSDKGTEQYQLQAQEIEKPYQNDEFLQEVIDKPGKNIAIVGEPGAGKTTWLDYIALHLEDGEYLPILIPLGSLSGQTLATYLQTTWLEEAQKFDNRVGVEELKTLFRSGKVWLLLDGVDEMQLDSGNLPLDVVGKNLSGWVAAARVALTCRLNVWEANPNALGNFDTFRTLQFDDEQVAEFIEQWFEKDRNPAAGQGLQEKLKEAGKERIRDLVKNPLRLALLCGTWIFHEGNLPETKAGLYQQFRENFYQWKPHRKLTKNSSKQRELHEALARLALAAIDRKMPLRKGFVEEVMGADLFELAEEVGWLNLVYWDGKTREPVYAFFHLTFQEYFAALAVEDWHFFLNHFPENPSHADASYRIFEPQWKQVILMWFGREDVEKERKEEFIEVLIEFDNRCDENSAFYKLRAYWLVAAGITEFKNCTKADEIVDSIVKWGFGYFNIEKQEWQTFLYPIKEGSESALLETDRTKAIAALVELIGTTQDEDTRRLAAASLGEIGKDNPRAIAALVELIGTNQDEDTRRLAAESLGKIGKNNPTAIAALVELIGTNQDEDTRRRTVESLGEIGKNNPTAIAALVELIGTNQDEDTRRLAANILGEIGKDNLTAIAALVELIGTNQDEDTRRLAANILGEIGKDNLTAIAALVELISTTQNEDIRRLAAYILGKIGKNNPTAIAALVELIGTNQDEDTRRLAADILGKIDKDNPRAIAALVELIGTTQDEDTRRLAAESLGEIDKDNPRAIAALVELIGTTQDGYTRRRAAYILGKIGKDNPRAIALVELICMTQDEYTRRVAADILGKIDKDNPRAIAALVELIGTTQDEDTRRLAAESLGEIDKDNPRAIAALVELIGTTQDEYTRRLAAASLGKIDKDNPRAIAALVELISTTQNEYTRRRTVESLGKIGKNNPTAIAALVELISTNQDKDIRRLAAESLGEIGKDNLTAIAALVELIGTNQDEDTRRLAAASLGEIGKDNPRAIAALVELIGTNQDEYTRWRAANILGKIGKDNLTAIAALVELISTTQNEDIRRLAADILGKIGKDNPRAIAALVELIGTNQDEYTRWRAAASLGKIDKDNSRAIAALVELIGTTQDEDTRRLAAASLGEIGKDNPRAIAALVELIGTTQNEDTRRRAANSLREIDKDSPRAIAALVELIATTQDEDTRRQAAYSLREILTTEQHMEGIVTALKNGLSNETYENDFDRFYDCYRVLWHCAQTLPYPKFYQAWHHPAITPHPEAADNIPAGNTPTVQNLEKLMAPLIEQLLPPDNTYLLAINATTLAGETDSSEIAQRLCNWIFDQIPGAEIPEVEKLGQLERQLSNLKKRLQKTTLALIILPGCSPYPELETFLRQLTSQLQICWLTDAKLAPPLRAISPQQEDLLSAIQSWLDEIG